MFGHTEDEFIGGVSEPSWAEVDGASDGSVHVGLHLAGTSKGECHWTTTAGGTLRVSGRHIEDVVSIGYTSTISGGIHHTVITGSSIALDTPLQMQWEYVMLPMVHGVTISVMLGDVITLRCSGGTSTVPHLVTGEHCSAHFL